MDEAVRKAHKRHFRNSGILFSLTMKNTIKTRRTLFLSLVAGLIVVIAVFSFVLKLTGHTTDSGYSIFAHLMSVTQLRVFLLILSVFYGTTVFSDELDQKTLVFLKSRPISPFSMILGKYMSALSITMLIIAFSTLISYCLLLGADGVENIFRYFNLVLIDIAVMILGAAVYIALMMMFALVFKKPVVWGMFFALIWENTVVNIPGFINKLTILHWLQSIFPHPTITNDFLSALNPEPATTSEALIVLVILSGIFLVFTWLFYQKKEFYLN